MVDQVGLGSSLYWLHECLSGGLGISNSQLYSGSEAWEASVTKAPAASKYSKPKERYISQRTLEVISIL